MVRAAHRSMSGLAIGLGLLVLTTACGGSTPSTAPQASVTTTAPAYVLADRETFLASGPDCEALTDWYAQFPADTDLDTAVARVSACGTLPEPFVDNPDRVGVSDLLVEALLSTTGAPVDPAARRTALVVLAQGGCDEFASNSKSLWQLQQTVADTGGGGDDYWQVVGIAAKELCPESADDLLMFDTKDPVGQASKFRAYIEATFDVPPATDSDYAAMAGVTCTRLRKGDSFTDASLLFEYMTIGQSGQGARIGRRAADLFCPSQS